MHRYNKNQIIKILNPCNALQCLQVAIVHHLDMPIMRQRAFHIAPGTENQIPITPTLYTANPQVRDIEQKSLSLNFSSQISQELSQRHFGLIAKTIALVVGQITLWKLQSSRKFYQIVLLEAKPMSTSHIKQFLKLTDTLPVFTKKFKSTKATISDNSSNFLNWQKIKQLK